MLIIYTWMHQHSSTLYFVPGGHGHHLHINAPTLFNTVLRSRWTWSPSTYQCANTLQHWTSFQVDMVIIYISMRQHSSTLNFVPGGHGHHLHMNTPTLFNTELRSRWTWSSSTHEYTNTLQHCTSFPVDMVTTYIWMHQHSSTLNIVPGGHGHQLHMNAPTLFNTEDRSRRTWSSSTYQCTNTLQHCTSFPVDMVTTYIWMHQHPATLNIVPGGHGHQLHMNAPTLFNTEDRSRWTWSSSTYECTNTLQHWTSFPADMVINYIWMHQHSSTLNFVPDGHGQHSSTLNIVPGGHGQHSSTLNFVPNGHGQHSSTLNIVPGGHGHQLHMNAPTLFNTEHRSRRTWSSITYECTNTLQHWTSFPADMVINYIWMHQHSSTLNFVPDGHGHQLHMNAPALYNTEHRSRRTWSSITYECINTFQHWTSFPADMVINYIWMHQHSSTLNFVPDGHGQHSSTLNIVPGGHGHQLHMNAPTLFNTELRSRRTWSTLFNTEHRSRRTWSSITYECTNTLQHWTSFPTDMVNTLQHWTSFPADMVINYIWMHQHSSTLNFVPDGHGQHSSTLNIVPGGHGHQLHMNAPTLFNTELRSRRTWSTLFNTEHRSRRTWSTLFNTEHRSRLTWSCNFADFFYCLYIISLVVMGFLMAHCLWWEKYQLK